MNFDLSEDQILLQDSVNRLLRKKLPADKAIEIFDSENGFDRDTWNRLFELGVGCILVPEVEGGLGMEMLDAALVAESAGYNAMPGPFIEQSLVIDAVARLGSDEQKAAWLPRLMAGETIATLAWSESSEINRPGEWKLAAGETLSGSKSHVVSGELADIFLVGLEGGRLALVERDARGLSLESLNSVDRTRMAARLDMDNTPCDLMKADESVVERLFDGLNVLLAADAFGGATRCNEMSLEYASTREQFGTLIVNFQSIKHKLADMKVDVELTRGLYWYAAHAHDHIPQDASRMAAMARAHICETYMQIARDSVEIHGGIGFTWEYPLQVFFKRAMFDRNYMGIPDTHYDFAADLEYQELTEPPTQGSHEQWQVKQI